MPFELAEGLQARLRVSAPRLVPELHQRAAGWYQDHGFPVEATRHALASGQWPQAAELLATIWQGFILDGEMVMLGQLVDQFPSEVVEADAELVTVRAARRLGAGDWDGADSDLRLAEQVAANLPQQRRRRFEVALATVSLYRARLRGDLDRAATSVEHALQVAEPEGYRQVFWNLGEEVQALRQRERGINAGSRCADRGLCRSRPTVAVKVMRSIGPLVCVYLSWR